MTVTGPTFDLRTWQQIVDYANADLTGNPKALKAAESLVRGLDDRMSFVDLVGSPQAGESLVDRFQKQAIRDQPTVQGLLRWLCKPVPNTLIPSWKAGGPISPVDVLYGELAGERLIQQGDPEFNEESPDYYPFYFVREVPFDSILGPICKFIVDEIEDSSEMAPVKICEREGCGRFTVSERKGRKRFCSDQCRALAFQRSREDWAGYMRKYRKVRSKMKKARAK